MSEIKVVNIADMKYSNNSETLVTYALGSCIGLAAYDPEVKAGALLHYMLPDSKLDKVKASHKPYMFADTGVIETFKVLKNLGCKSQRLIVKAAGGSNIMDPNCAFNIGKRNFLALKKILWRFSIIIKGQDIGGNVSRNMTLNLETFSVTVRYSGKKEERVL